MAKSAFDTIGGIFDGDVRIRRSRPKDLAAVKARARRVVRRAPEVMVKISGFGKGSAHVGAHLSYIGREGNLTLENERGELISGKEAIQELRDEWMADRGRANKNTRDTTHIVLSMPPGTNRKAVTAASREFAKEQFGKNHQYVFVAHEDEKHPHVHLTVKNLGYDGTRLHVKRGDPQKWRELFAEKLRNQGVDAEATARLTRGVVRKPVKQSVLHMRKRGVTPNTDKAKMLEAMAEIKAKKPPEQPWKQKIQQRHTDVRRGWVEAAQALTGEDNVLAGDILRFVKSMPAVSTLRDDIKRKLELDKNAGIDVDAEIQR